MWKHVKPGGVYVIEDVETSFYPKGKVYGYTYESGMMASREQNEMKRFQQYADVMNRGYFPSDVNNYSLLEGDDAIEEIGYSRNIVYIKKANECQVDGKTTVAYPVDPINLPGKETISASANETKRLFVEGSKYLDKRRTTPSYKKGPK